MLNKPKAKKAVPAAVDCAKVKDADIVKAIQEKIKADPSFNAQRIRPRSPLHIHVSCKKGVVKLEGFVTIKNGIKALGQLAKTTNCVKKVENKLGKTIKIGCGPGEKQCGDICIDENSRCNLIL